MQFEDWSGERYVLSVDLVDGLAQLVSPRLAGVPAVDALTRSVFEKCQRMLRLSKGLDIDRYARGLHLQVKSSTSFGGDP